MKFLITRSVYLVCMSEINVGVLIRTRRTGFFSIYIMVMALISLFFFSSGHGSVSLSLFFSFFILFFYYFLWSWLWVFFVLEFEDLHHKLSITFLDE